MKQYGNSLYAILRTVYPHYDWDPWRFSLLPRSTIGDSTVLKQAILHVEKNLSIEQPEDWYRVSLNQLKRLGVDALFRKSGGLVSVLERLRPEIQWNEKNFAFTKEK